MKVIKNDTAVLMGTWVDPGDYPNDVAAGPLPSYNYLEGVEGELVVELTDDEQFEVVLCKMLERTTDSHVVTTEDQIFSEWFDETVDPPLLDGILSCVWQGTLKGNILTLEVIEVEEDPNWQPWSAHDLVYEQDKEDRRKAQHD